MIDYQIIKLSKDEKKALQELKKSAGYKVLQRIEEEQRRQLGDVMIKIDVGNTEQLKELQKMQFYALGRQKFLEAIEKHTFDAEILSFSDDGTSIESMEKIISEQI